MTANKKVKIMYFTDVLCIWAYLAQIRIDELKTKFGDDVILQKHFIPVFGSVNSKMQDNWGDKGGVAAYCEHVQSVAKNFGHIDIHPDVWAKNTPTTSTSCHLFLKAIQILCDNGEIPNTVMYEGIEKNTFELMVWKMRVAFFKDAIDVSGLSEQMKIAEKVDLPLDKIKNLIENGVAFAGLDDDLQLKEKYGVSGSPTLVLNEGRQIIYGNVGYRVIEANIQELLTQPEYQASWC
ncbi:MAG: DsbA family protein [Gammaproteobacteria bacterium]|nr:DsbA family protein [Gammaproteobacteria bacterium]MDH5659558.1 DsbA family protein [Gammaproteobacteria bacterium]